MTIAHEVLNVLGLIGETIALSLAVHGLADFRTLARSAYDLSIAAISALELRLLDPRPADPVFYPAGLALHPPKQVGPGNDDTAAHGGGHDDNLEQCS